MATEMKLITDITLELTGETKRYEVVAKQGDKATRFIRITLKNNGQDFEIPAGMKVIANIQKPDRKCCYNTCSYSGSTVTMELTNQALAVAGTAECDIEIRDANDEVVLSSQAFTIEIEKSMRDENAIRSSNEFTQLEQDVREYAEKYFEENPVSGMTQKQINALDSLFRVIAYSDNDVLNSEYKNFKEAFGLSSEDEPGDAGEGLLKNGSATFSNGATLTVSDGKHVSLYLPKKDVYQCYFNISDYEKNTTDTGSAANVDNQLPIYTLKKGDTVSISMYNIIVNGGNETYPGGYQEQMAINLRKANSNISCSTNNVSIHGGEAIEDKTSITEMESAEYVGALMLFVQNNSSDITIMFDIDVKVNGETIKWY